MLEMFSLSKSTKVNDCLCRFVPYKFEEIFSKFAKSDKTRITFSELMEMTAACRNVADPFGWYVPNDQTISIRLDG